MKRAFLAILVSILLADTERIVRRDAELGALEGELTTGKLLDAECREEHDEFNSQRKFNMVEDDNEFS